MPQSFSYDRRIPGSTQTRDLRWIEVKNHDEMIRLACGSEWKEVRGTRTLQSVVLKRRK